MSRPAALGRFDEVELPQGRIRFRELGEGPPIVFVHGIVANGDLWRRVAPAMAHGYRCVVPDWPLGSHEVGLSPGADLSLPGLARIVHDFLVARDLYDVALVGNDTGGAICQAVAAHLPERIGRLVLTSCDAFDNFLPPILRHLQVLGRSEAVLRAIGQALRFRVVQRLPIAFGRLTMLPIDPEVMASFTAPLRKRPDVRRDFARLCREISARHTEDAARLLPGFPRPALVAWALEDRLFPLAHAHRLAQHLPAARLEVIPDSRAFIPEDQPEALVSILEDFLGRGGSPSEGASLGRDRPLSSD